jgi:hypothetical protein
MPVLSGIGLMIIPYFISNLLVLVLCGAVLMGLPFFIHL